MNRGPLLWNPGKVEFKNGGFSSNYKYSFRGFFGGGFHRALLQSIAFISRLNALDYTKLRSYNLHCLKILKDIKFKITPTCFGSYAIHHHGV